MTIDWTKPIQTRDGKKVRILCRDRLGINNIIGLIMNNNIETVETWHDDGSYHGHKSSFDLVNVSQKIYINIYRYNDGSIGSCCQYENTEEAQKQKHCNPHYIKTIEVEI